MSDPGNPSLQFALQAIRDEATQEAATRIAALEAQILTLKADLAGDRAMIEALSETALRALLVARKYVYEATVDEFDGNVANLTLVDGAIDDVAKARRTATRLERIRSILEDLVAGNHSATVEQLARQALAISYEGERTDG